MEDEKRFYVYYLRRPDKVDPLELRPGCPFYVGKGVNCRYLEHRREALSLLHKPGRKSIRIKIIHKLWKQGLDFTEEITFDNLTEQEAFEIEIQAIEAYGRIDIKTGCLANYTNGGEGASGCIQSEQKIAKLKEYKGPKHPCYKRPRSEETKKRIGRATSKALKGRTKPPMPEETKEKLRQIGLGRKRSPEDIQKWKESYNKTTKTQTPESNEKRRQTLLKYNQEKRENSPPKIKPKTEKKPRKSPGPMPEKTKRKISESNKGKVKSEETREKLRQANTGKIHSQESRKRISDSHKGVPWSKARREAENKRKEKKK